MKELILEILKSSFNLEIENKTTLNEDNLAINLPNGKIVKIFVK